VTASVRDLLRRLLYSVGIAQLHHDLVRTAFGVRVQPIHLGLVAALMVSIFAAQHGQQIPQVLGDFDRGHGYLCPFAAVSEKRAADDSVGVSRTKALASERHAEASSRNRVRIFVLDDGLRRLVANHEVVSDRFAVSDAA
jgi:hypothetical protein